MEMTMPDNRKPNDKKTANAPKDLPAKPVDKKTDDKVKGGLGGFKSL